MYVQTRQTGPQSRSPITGVKKNCGTWAEYEPGYSGSAAMCNGGTYDDDTYNPCPAREYCKQETRNKQARSNRTLPILNTGKPFGYRPGSNLIASTPNTKEQSWRSKLEEWKNRPFPMSQYTTQRTSQEECDTRLPHPVQPPSDWPESMRTPFASPIPVTGNGFSPTFLPAAGEDPFERLGKNLIQGALSAIGWQIFDFARNVDMFRSR